MIWMLLAMLAHAGTLRVLEPKVEGLATNGAVVVRAEAEPRVKVRVDGRRERVTVEPWPSGSSRGLRPRRAPA